MYTVRKVVRKAMEVADASLRGRSANLQRLSMRVDACRCKKEESEDLGRYQKVEKVQSPIGEGRSLKAAKGR